MKHKGILFHTNPNTGEQQIEEIDLTFESHTAVCAWAEDFFRAMRGRPRIYLVLIKLFMGRYAYRELIGMRDQLTKEHFLTDNLYYCQNQKYHDDKVRDLWS